MAHIVKLEKWGSTVPSKLQFSLGAAVREHEYYRCFSVDGQKGGEKMLLWKFHGAANPFISLLELFQLYALPTRHVVTRQLIRFIARSWKAFRKGKTMRDFHLEFYYAKWQRQQPVEAAENEEINKVMQSIEKMCDE
jgi:hypothetical protein